MAFKDNSVFSGAGLSVRDYIALQFMLAILDQEVNEDASEEQLIDAIIAMADLFITRLEKSNEKA